MGKIDYNEISRIYDSVREEQIEIINCFLEGADISENTAILDIGCGTGNYTNLIHRITKSRVYGMDMSEGMLEKAKEKNKNINFIIGSAEDIPLQDSHFDFVYMTDVIHHVPNIEKMFCEIYRILKKGGKVCIATQSYNQIDLRYMTEFFPDTAAQDKGRYPDIEDIVKAACKNGLKHIKDQIISDGVEVELGQNYIELLEKKGYSMLHLISEESYWEGLNKVKQEMKNGSIKRKTAGETLVWFIK